MKILIVDDQPETKCGGIIEEFAKRGITTEIVTNQRQFMVALERQNGLDGIVLDMAFPLSNSSDFMDVMAGERALKHLKKEENKVPVLIFSKIEPLGTYENLFGQIKDWNAEEEKNKFFEYLKHVEKRKLSKVAV